MRFAIALGVALTVVGLAACDQAGGSGGDPGTGTPSKPTAKATAAATATATAAATEAPAATGTAAATSTVPEFGVPDIPSGESNPPTVEEWTAAAEVNTQGPGARPNNCYMKIVREWLKVHCDGNVTGIKDPEQIESQLGPENRHHYKSITIGKAADFVVRLRKGHSINLKILRDDQDAALFVSWPPSEAKPLHVALGIGKR